jgi:D-alanine-D-alanine ligase
VTTVGIIFGGANSEHEVSCNSARSVAEHLDRDRFDLVLLGIDRDGGWHSVSSVDDLESAGTGAQFPDLAGVDVAFPVLHGRFGEDGTVQGLLELTGLPYVGCGVLASALAMDKAIAQRLLVADGIPTIPTFATTAATVADAAAAADAFGYPVFVKPNRAGSSVGVSRVDTAADLDAALDLALSHDSVALVQQAVTGDEVDLGVLQLPSGELSVGAPLRILPKTSEFFDYAAKYTAGATELEVPAKIPDDVAERLVEFAKRAFASLDCEGLARVDFFVTAAGEIMLNEVNTLPGLTAFSQYPRMWQAKGISYTELLSLLIERATVARPARA